MTEESEFFEDRGYRVRRYEPPQIGDLRTHQALLKGFEERFFRNIHRAHEIPRTSKPEKLDAYISTKKNEYRILKGLPAPENPKEKEEYEELKKAYEAEGPMELSEHEAKLLLTESLLCGAMLRRAYFNMKTHIMLRIERARHKEGAADISSELKDLEEKIERDMAGGTKSERKTIPPDQLIATDRLRLVRTHDVLDMDGVLDEMKGEPRNIFTSSLTERKSEDGPSYSKIIKGTSRNFCIGIGVVL